MNQIATSPNSSEALVNIQIAIAEIENELLNT